MPAVRATGPSGVVRHGYQEAATLGAWTLELLPGAPRRYRLEAEVRSRHWHWAAQDPLVLELRIGTATWAWTLGAPLEPGARLALALAGPPVITRDTHS